MHMEQKHEPVASTASSSTGQESDLPLRTLWIGVAILVVLTFGVALFASFPKLFAEPGEDRSLIEPADPDVHAIFVQARDGSAEAMNNLAVIYLQGQREVPDPAKAVKWLRMASAKGHAGARYNLAQLCLAGKGTEKNEAEAMQWFERAANLGHAQSMMQLGVGYATGRGVTMDRMQATQWLQRAAGSSDNETRKTAATLLQQMGK